jgi:hypothetical protein
VRGRFDAVVSVEMIEAVGAEFWPEFFGTLERVLAPGGRIALQAITMADDRMLATNGTYTWIGKYVFPGGLIPSPEAIEREAAAHGLRVADDASFGPHYAETLRLWRERFAAATDAGRVAPLGFDATFGRMWEFYLAYSEAGFRSRYLDVQQTLLTRAPAEPSGRADRAEPAGTAAPAGLAVGRGGGPAEPGEREPGTGSDRETGSGSVGGPGASSAVAHPADRTATGRTDRAEPGGAGRVCGALPARGPGGVDGHGGFAVAGDGGSVEPGSAGGVEGVGR